MQLSHDFQPRPFAPTGSRTPECGRQGTSGRRRPQPRGVGRALAWICGFALAPTAGATASASGSDPQSETLEASPLGGPLDPNAAHSPPGPEPDPPKKAQKKSKAPWKLPSELELRARVIAGWEYERDRPLSEAVAGVTEDVDEFGFFLRHARLKAKLAMGEHIEIKTSFDLSDAFGNPQRMQFLRDAYVELRMHDAFRLTAGRFKRPFSRQALRSVFKIPVRSRGSFHREALRDDEDSLAWAARGLGLMFHGKIPYADAKGSVRWSASVTDPTGSRDFLDVHGRVRVDLPKVASLGVHAGYRRRGFDAELPGANFAAVGGDVRLEWGDFRADLETNAVQNILDDDPDGPGWLIGTLVQLSYPIKLDEGWKIRPVLAFEFADENLDFARSELFSGTAGVNVQWGKHVRILPEVRIDRTTATPADTSRWSAGETYSISLAVDL